MADQWRRWAVVAALAFLCLTLVGACSTAPPNDVHDVDDVDDGGNGDDTDDPDDADDTDEGEDTGDDPDGPGSLAVLISGLPVGVPAAVTVTGPDGFEAVLESSAVLTPLTPGTYLIAAAAVSGNDEVVPRGFTPAVGDASPEVDSAQVVTVDVTYARTPGSGRLWVSSYGETALSGFDPGQLTHSGAPVPAAVATVSTGSMSRGVAVDAAGNVWLADTLAEVVRRFPASELAEGGTVAPDVVIDFAGIERAGPWDLAFDPAGNLWVLTVNATPALVRFAAQDLQQSGSPEPDSVIEDVVHLFIHTVLAFDHDGNMWVMNTYELKTVVMYTPEQLDLGGSPTPAVTLDFAPVITGFLHHVAFDGDGNMWVQLVGEGILRVPAAVLTESGAPEPDAIIAAATFGDSASESIAFDHGGDLWVVLREPDGIGRIASPASLEGSVMPPLEVVIASALSDLRQIAFAPPPPDLPIWAP